LSARASNEPLDSGVAPCIAACAGESGSAPHPRGRSESATQ
jgi:hypothetical protein